MNPNFKILIFFYTYHRQVHENSLIVESVNRVEILILVRLVIYLFIYLFSFSAPWTIFLVFMDFDCTVSTSILYSHDYSSIIKKLEISQSILE